jgi:glycosyltransferase involved in cell wall biosynthesis
VSLFSVLRKPAISVSTVQARTYAPLMKLDLPRSIWHELLAWRADVVHMHSLYVSANALLARKLRRRRVPYVITPHGATNEQLMLRRSYLKRPYQAFVERPTLSRAAFARRGARDVAQAAAGAR